MRKRTRICRDRTQDLVPSYMQVCVLPNFFPLHALSCSNFFFLILPSSLPLTPNHYLPSLFLCPSLFLPRYQAPLFVLSRTAFNSIGLPSTCLPISKNSAVITLHESIDYFSRHSIEYFLLRRILFKRATELEVVPRPR